MPSMGDRCRSGGSGHARAGRGVTRLRRPAHLPADGPVMPSEISKRGAHPCPEGSCGGNTRPAAGGERTLMGPAAHSRAGPKKRLYSCESRMLNERTGERLESWPHDPAGEDESRVTPGQSNDIAETRGTGLAPVGSPPEESNQQASTAGACDRRYPGRRLLKRIGALKPAEWGRATPHDWRNRRPPSGFVCRKLRSGVGCRLGGVCRAGGCWGWLPWLG